MNDKSEKKIYGIFIRSILTRKVILSINEIGKNIKQNLEQKIIEKTEGKCVSEGFIRPNSVKIINYSSGLINNDNVEFQSSFECMVSYPVEGQLMECTVKTITKAGIHAEVVIEDGIVPITVFVARDHHNTDTYFSTIKENSIILVRIVGVRFELNDPYICVIGQLMDKSRMDDRTGSRGGTGATVGLSRIIVHDN